MPMMPILLPVQEHPAQRDCVLIHGRTYCAVEEDNGKDAGVALLGGAALFLYCGFLVWLAVDRDKPALAVTLFIAPIVLGGLFLVLR